PHVRRAASHGELLPLTEHLRSLRGAFCVLHPAGARLRAAARLVPGRRACRARSRALRGQGAARSAAAPARRRSRVHAGRGAGGEGERPPSPTKGTRMLTRHSAIPPSGDVTTLVSLIQAPWMFLMVSAALARPVRTASSTLVGDEALSSMIMATAMDFLHWCDANGRGCNRLHLHPLRQRPRSVDCYDSTDESRPQPRAGRPDGRRQVLDRPPP